MFDALDAFQRESDGLYWNLSDISSETIIEFVLIVGFDSKYVFRRKIAVISRFDNYLENSARKYYTYFEVVESNSK